MDSIGGGNGIDEGVEEDGVSEESNGSEETLVHVNAPIGDNDMYSDKKKDD